MTFTYDTTGPIKCIIAAYTTDDSAGTASAATRKVSGYLLRGVTKPTVAHTASWDLVLTDAQSANVLTNSFDDLVDRNTTATEIVDFFLKDGTASNGARPCICGPITCSVSNAGNSKTGTFYIYVDGEIQPGET